MPNSRRSIVTKVNEILGKYYENAKLNAEIELISDMYFKGNHIDLLKGTDGSIKSIKDPDVKNEIKKLVDEKVKEEYIDESDILPQKPDTPRTVRISEITTPTPRNISPQQPVNQNDVFGPNHVINLNKVTKRSNNISNNQEGIEQSRRKRRQNRIKKAKVKEII